MRLITRFVDPLLLDGKSYRPNLDQTNTDPEVQRIIQIAAILRQILHADMVPMILDHAKYWHTFRSSAETWKAEYVFEAISPLLCGRLIIPPYVLQGSIRSVHFSITSHGHGKANNTQSSTSEAAWFEAGVAGLDGEGRNPKKRYFPILNCLYTWPQYRSEYKYGSKKICQNEEDVECTSCHTGFTEHKVEWIADDSDRDVRKIMRELQGGSAIEVTAFAESPWINCVRDVAIEVKWAPVTKM